MRLPFRSDIRAYMEEHGVSEDAAKRALWPEDLALEAMAHSYYHTQNVPYEEARALICQSGRAVAELLLQRDRLADKLEDAGYTLRDAEVELEYAEEMLGVPSAFEEDREDNLRWAQQDFNRAENDYRTAKSELNKVVKLLEKEGWTY